jgi:molecular chaperone GrpE
MQSSRASERDSPAATAHESESRPETEAESEQTAELEQLRARLVEAEDRSLRARADLDNYRKRADRELERRVLAERDALLLRWLEVVDSVERALALEAEHPEAARGLHAVHEQMKTLLARDGVEPIGAPGEEFDPELHEAVLAVPTADRPPGTIVDVARSGYRAGERVLRPAQVAVASAPHRAG